MIYDALAARFETLSVAWDPDNPLSGRNADDHRPVDPRAHMSCRIHMRSVENPLPGSSIAAALRVACPPVGVCGARAGSQARAVDRARSLGARASASIGAIAFTPDGSFTSTWKRATKTEAEDKVRAECTGLARGKCEVLSFGPDVCAALASGQISKQRKITYSGGGMTRAAAEKVALFRCNADRRAHGSCEMRTVLCGDGR